MTEEERIELESTRKRLRELEELERIEISQIREYRHSLIVKHIDALLEIASVHSRTSCSDTNPGNSYKCGRCALLDIKRCGFVFSDMIVDVVFNIQIDQDAADQRYG